MIFLRKVWSVEANRYVILGTLLLFGYVGYFKLYPSVDLYLQILYKNSSDQVSSVNDGDEVDGATVTFYDKKGVLLATGERSTNWYFDRVHFSNFRLGDCLAMKKELRHRRIYKKKGSSYSALSEKELLFKHHDCRTANRRWVGSWIYRAALIKIDHANCKTSKVPFTKKWRGYPQEREYRNKFGELRFKDGNIPYLAAGYNSGGGGGGGDGIVRYSFRLVLTPEMCAGS